MKKLIFANDHFSLNDALFNKYARLRDSGLLVTGMAPMSRVRPSGSYKIIHPIPSNINNISFKDATDNRAQDVIDLCLQSDLPIVVMYSGGIDSTTVLTSVVKHFPKDLLERVVVRMTNASYVENPSFFNNVVLKNNIRHTHEKIYDYNNAIILHGDPADSLWLGGNVLNFNSIYPNSHNKTIVEAEGILLDYLTKRSNKEYAQWLFHFLQDEANEVGLQLKTISDFFWWIIFNYNYPLMCLKHASEVTNIPEGINYENYMKNFVPWFATDDYQSWSISAQYKQTKFDGTVRSYKMEAKQYIYKFDKNQWYRDYKTKVHSRYWSDTECNIIAAIYEDGEIVLND